MTKNCLISKINMRSVLLMKKNYFEQKWQSCLRVQVVGRKSCTSKVKMGTEQWTSVQESLLLLEKRNVASVDFIFWNGMEANLVVRAQLSSAATSSLKDLDVANRNLLCCIEGKFIIVLARGNIVLMVDPYFNDLRDLKSVHYHKIVEITKNAGKCLEKEYMLKI
ncbi:hypothetical protein GIB67_016182 [Kingdonia uniflora]|uniref:Uncharacterized protein n=1 Tax=Kingdonia uniflora TaxID=39325 RepID=A0A7J7LSU9_9MAGN|nr:hypothetical protein GIB67_016182 [Kingdonia uniflora]